MEKDVLSDEELLEYGIAVPYFNYGDDDKLSMEVVAKAKTLPECVVIRLTGFIDEYNYTLFQKRVKTAMRAALARSSLTARISRIFLQRALGHFRPCSIY